MANVVFVAPFFLDTTLRFVEAVADTEGVRLGLVSQDPEDKLPAGLRAKLAGHYRVDHGLESKAVAQATRALARQLGGVDRLLGTLEELQVPLAEVREELGLPGMGVETARNFRDKSRMKTVLREAGLPCARHRLVSHTEEAWEFVKDVGFPLVVKPPAGAGAKNTFRVNGERELDDYLMYLPLDASRPALFEEFLSGEEHSFDSVCIKGRIVWHSINRYYPGPLEVLRHPWIQWCVLLPREVDDPRFSGIRKVAKRSLQALGLDTGLSHLEWFLRGDGSVAVSEVAARPPGAQFMTLISYAHDADLYRAWARLMVYDEFTPPERRYAAGAAFLRGQGQGRVKAIHGLDEAQREVEGLVVEVKLPRAGQAPSGSYEGEGYVILRHRETAVVEAALKRLVTLVRVELG